MKNNNKNKTSLAIFFTIVATLGMLAASTTVQRVMAALPSGTTNTTKFLFIL
jgi:hypothetical protein